MIYLVGVVGLAFLALLGALKVEAIRVKGAQADTAVATAAATSARAANQALAADLKALDGRYAKSQADLLAAGKRDAARSADTARRLAAYDEQDQAQRTRIAALEAAALQPTTGDAHAKALATLHELAVDLMRDDGR